MALTHATWRILLLSALFACSARTGAREPIDWVDPRIGTAGVGSQYGGTAPVVGRPFAMTFWSPLTRQNRVSVATYNDADRRIQGFIGTHQAAIWMGDYGYVTLMPEIGDVKYAPEARSLPFERRDERVAPDGYAVTMQTDAGPLHAELTASGHAGHLRFTFPRGSDASVLVEATRPHVRGFVEVDPERREVRGYNPDRQDADLGPLALPNFKGYFVARFRQPFRRFNVYEGVLGWPDRRAVEGENVGALVSFDVRDGQPVEVQVGTSFIGIEQARANLDAEMPRWAFEAERTALRDVWNAKLGAIEIDGATDAQRTIFHTALFHALLFPKDITEQGRYYSAFDDRVHAGKAYTAFSIWDTFRAQNALLTLLEPQRSGDMVQALLQDFREGGWMPKWPNPSYTNIMIGTHADSLVAEALVKGIGGFDRELAWKAVLKDATQAPDGDTTRRWFDREPHTPYEARPGLTYAKTLGYVPADKVSESASSTIEEAYDDYAVARVAEALGRKEDAAFFRQRSLGYRALFNPARGFLQARNADGGWADPADGWTEGDQWVYLFGALHDIPGTVALLGGAKAAEAKLDEHFDGGHNHHDNEPSHHYAYAYNFFGAPWKAQAKVRELLATAYDTTPTGILGNEDCGQMSAWYVFSALGFYPLNPASGEYMIGSPLFARARLRLPNGRVFEVIAEDQAVDHPYIQSATLDGRPLNVPVLRHADIVAGGKLVFRMGATPSRWAADWVPPAPQVVGTETVPSHASGMHSHK